MDETKDEYNDQKQQPEIKEKEDAIDLQTSDGHEQDSNEQSKRKVSPIQYFHIFYYRTKNNY